MSDPAPRRAPEPRRKSLRFAAIALALAACAAALLSFAAAKRSAALEGDERDYLRAATHLERSGTLSHASVDAAAPPPDAYREPAYSALVAGAWKLGRCEPPTSETALARAIAPGICTARATRVLHLILLGATMAGSAAAASVVGGSRLASLAAAALVGASPALRESALGLASENLAAPLLVLFSAALAALCEERARSLPLLLVAALAAGLAPLARSALLALPFVGAALLLLFRPLAGDELGMRARRALLFLAVSLMPAILWTGRNSRQLGHAVLSDSRAVLRIRLELDRQVESEGALAAALHFTPLESARRLARRLAPEHTYDRFQWEGEGNYITRAMTAWSAERAGAADALAVDRRIGREALTRMFDRPGVHLATTVVAAWRGLFAERSPAWARPFDLAFPLGLLLATGFVARLARSAQQVERQSLALLLPTASLFGFHAFLTEFLPRFGAPSLPILWVTAVLLVESAIRNWRASRAPVTVPAG